MTQGNSGRKNWTRAKGYSLEELGLTKENFADFYKKWKNNELQFIDTEAVGKELQAEWERLSSDEANIHEKRFKKLLIGLGDTYSDLRTIDKEEFKNSWKNPFDFQQQILTATALRGFEGVGWLSDKTLGFAGRRIGKHILGLDEGNQQLLGIAAQFAAPSVMKQIPKVPKIPAVKRGVYNAGVSVGQQYRGGKRIVNTLKKVYDQNFSKTPSKRVITVKAEQLIDEALNTPNYKDIVRVAKKNNISLSKAKAYIDLKTRAIRPDQTLNPGTNAGLLKESTDPNLTRGYKKGGLLDPNRDDTTKFSFMAENKGSEFTQRVIEGMSDEDLAPYTLKIREQPWEKSPENLLELTTGIPQKLEQPLPYGQKYTLIPDKERGRPLRQIVKEDINLGSSRFKIGKDPIDKVVRNFRRRIIGLMQIDRIRSTDVGTKVGFSRTARNINKFTEGTSEISNTYFDYLVGYFNRFIRPGKVKNFDGAVNLIAPKVKGKEIIPNQIQTVKGNPALIRELRLFTIAPDVYGSGAFKTTDQTYQAKLKTILRKISSVDDAGELKLWDKRQQIFKYKVDAHHVDQIAEGWVLYEGLPKEEIPKMRKLIQAYGLQPGNHSENAKLIIKQLHQRYHAKYWPDALKTLETTGEGWPTLNEAARQKLLRIKTAAGRDDYVRRYVEATMESQKLVDRDVNEILTRLANQKNKAIEQLTRQEIDNIIREIDIIDPSPAWDRSVKAPKDIQKDLDYEDFLNKLFNRTDD